MRVLHLISSGGMYGAEAVILNLSEAINTGAGDHSAIGVFSHPDQPAPKLYEVALERGIEAHLIACRGQADISVPRTFRSLAERTHAEVVHTHGYKADIYAAFAWRMMRPVLVSTCHTWYDNDLALRLYGAADRWVLREFDGVVAVANEVRTRLQSAGVQGERIQLIQNGVDVQPLSKAGARRKEGLELRIGLVGRLAPEKGIDLFVQAAAILTATHPALRFLVAGDGPDRTALEAQARQLGLGERFTFVGRQEDMPTFYGSIDILVSASRQEGLPIALLEGMASGLPVIATRVGAVPEVVIDRETGLLVQPEDVAALAAGIERLVVTADLRRTLSRAGQQRVEDHFSATRMTGDYLDFYRGALERRMRLARPRTCTSCS